MNDKVPFALRAAKYLIAGLAIVNLAALLFFPSLFPQASQGGHTNASAEAGTAGETSAASSAPDAETDEYVIELESDTLVYDGSGTLDLLEGVSLVGPDGQVSNQDVFAYIRAGDTLSQKIVEYTAETPAGQVSATRTLELANYSGPSLELPESIPAIADNELDGLLDQLLAGGEIHADDGYGNDISQSVTASYTREEENPYLARYVFTVSNSFNDSVSVSVDVDITPLPIITLTADEVTVPLNSSFSVLSYVADAVDTDGSSLMRNIIVDGEVDTSVAGEYILTYQAHSPSGAYSNPVELRVIVA